MTHPAAYRAVYRTMPPHGAPDHVVAVTTDTCLTGRAVTILRGPSGQVEAAPSIHLQAA
jgi:hypothetical protein